MRKDRSFRGFLIVVLLAGLFGRVATVMAGVLSGNEICDTKADYFLGVEDYPETAKLHRLLIAAHPKTHSRTTISVSPTECSADTLTSLRNITRRRASV